MAAGEYLEDDTVSVTWKVIEGDCLQHLAAMGGLYGAVLTDPPFGIDYKSGHATDRLWKGGRLIAGDKSIEVRDAALAMLDPVPTLAFGSWRAPRPIATRQVLVWDKGGALGMGALDIPWKPDHEEIYVIGSGWAGSRDCGSVLRHAPVQSMAKNGRVHPNEKPVALLLDLLRKLPPRCTVIDPFCGSGSTGVACVRSGRGFIGIEIDPTYAAIARRRISEAANHLFAGGAA